MNKKVLSTILLCLVLLSFIFTIVIFVNTGISLYQLENSEIDTTNDKLPGASVIAVAFAYIGLWIGSILTSGITSSIGFMCSLVNTKITQNMIIHRISKAFLYFYSVVLVLIFSAFIFSLFLFSNKTNSNLSNRIELTPIDLAICRGYSLS